MANKTENKEIRITKAMRYADIKALLSGEATKHNTTIEDAIAFIDNEVALLAKKNASVSKADAEKKLKDAEYMDAIVSYLEGLENDDPGRTCSDIGKAVPMLNDFNTSKMSFLCRTLYKEGRIGFHIVKGKTLFNLPSRIK